ncbi:MAG TPA: TylF/MycF/NovP-related O-methyltransferase [Acetobacteraceae bacterium]|jgi:O-methyltransferase|nr:TylF/MycF/NovP-related O-methyltransferase [Acetobacteraceae bacterium]
MADDPRSAGLLVPGVFFGLNDDSALTALRNLANVAGAGDPRGPWFLADNLITYAHTRGFLTEPRFVGAVLASHPEATERAIAWRTHTLCWAADSVSHLPGDYVECGTYQGYSAEVLMHFTSGLSGRRFWLYDLFDPSGGTGEGHRLPAHAPDLVVKVRARFQRWRNVVVTQGKVPDVLGEASPDQIAFLHIDMNNAEAERGALENLFSRVSTGGIVVLDDYGWNGYRAQKDSADEFMRLRGLSVLELPTGQGLVVKR